MTEPSLESTPDRVEGQPRPGLFSRPGDASDADRRLLCVGASVRALAASVARAGWSPVALDLYADEDLLELGTVVRLDPARRFADAVDLADRIDPEGRMPVLYTGPMENHEDVLARLTERRACWGVAAESLGAVREPRALASVLREAGLPALEIAEEASRLPEDGSWLVKPRASSAGRQVEAWTGQAPPSEPVYFQRRVRTGTPLAALFLAGPDRGVSLLGITRQILDRFAFRGSVGPWPVAEAVEHRIIRLGEALAGALPLRGLFGVDLVLEGATPWAVEINPRYTASVEVLELAHGRSLLSGHLAAFLGDSPGGDPPPGPGRRHACVGKQVLMAGQDLTMPAVAALRPDAGAGPWDLPQVADIPSVGTEIRAGKPILTVFATGEDPRVCDEHLFERAYLIRKLLEQAVTSASGSPTGEP